jgi:hypothetical protein
VIAHLTGMISSYVVLLTAFYVDNAHLFPGFNQLPIIVFWVAPSLIALPFLVRSIRRFLPKTTTTSSPAPSPPSAIAPVERDGVDRQPSKTHVSSDA